MPILPRNEIKELIKGMVVGLAIIYLLHFMGD